MAGHDHAYEWLSQLKQLKHLGLRVYRRQHLQAAALPSMLTSLRLLCGSGACVVPVPLSSEVRSWPRLQLLQVLGAKDNFGSLEGFNCRTVRAVAC